MVKSVKFTEPMEGPMTAFEVWFIAGIVAEIILVIYGIVLVIKHRSLKAFVIPIDRLVAKATYPIRRG